MRRKARVEFEVFRVPTFSFDSARVVGIPLGLSPRRTGQHEPA